MAAVGAVIALGLAACGGAGPGGSSAPKGMTIGVALPTRTSERWIADGRAVTSQLEAKGYRVDLQYAGDDVPTQAQQVDQMITHGVDLLIIAAVDGTALGSQLQDAADEHIPVIAYDRLIRNSRNVDFYVSFDNYEVGVAQANALLTGLGLLKEDGSKGPATGPFDIELFAGSLDDNNAHFFFDGAMDTLGPYLDDGTLKVKSGQTTIQQTATPRWQQETARQRMQDLLIKSYNDGTRVDGVLSPYDGMSRGIITALQNAGYGAEGAPMPPVTGQDAEIASVKLISEGIQSSTIFKDNRRLAARAVAAAQDLLQKRTPAANDTVTYDNGVTVVPSYLLPVVTVYKDDIQQDLIDTGYWTAAEVASGRAGT
ncbi:MAG TPA: multiple monosaccharide ABC transporter substrate-binding protein [Blastococcus sp.]|jgi:putative multiple sugar transport system substrate-binding protein|nr:multiple monosaccharide ABC transporter substrate-binding protein [Blastococcus sp.]